MTHSSDSGEGPWGAQPHALFPQVYPLGALPSRPAARQLRHSLLAYMQTERFQPTESIDLKTAEALFKPPPTSEFEGAPTDLARAVLNVRAAPKVTMGKPEPWSAEVDEHVTLQEIFGYRIGGQTWRDGGGSAWFD